MMWLLVPRVHGRTRGATVIALNLPDVWQEATKAGDSGWRHSDPPGKLYETSAGVVAREISNVGNVSRNSESVVPQTSGLKATLAVMPPSIPDS